MTLTIAPETVPLVKDANGVICVGKTRVTLVEIARVQDVGLSGADDPTILE